MGNAELEKALKKGSMSAIAKAYINMNPNGVSVDDVHKFLSDNKVDKDRHQVYTTLQTMASTGRIRRGSVKGTFIPTGDEPIPEKVVADKVVKEAKKPQSERIVKAQVPVYSNEDVFTYLIEQLGDPREFTMQTIGHTYTLLGEASGAYLIDRYRLATGKDPVAWSVNKVGPNAAVVFLDA